MSNLPTTRKLVTLPDAKWEELIKDGYHIPKGTFDPTIGAKTVSFTKLIDLLNRKKKQALLIALLKDIMKPLSSDKVGLLLAAAEQEGLTDISEFLEETTEIVHKYEQRVGEIIESDE